MKKKPHLIGIEGHSGASRKGTELAAMILHNQLDLSLDCLLQEQASGTKREALKGITALNQKLAEKTYELVQSNTQFITLGGDHSSAIGCFSGASCALGDQSLGLIWIDAHMDAHTPETSDSQNIHGMPVAVLLGRGYPELCKLACDRPKLQPSHLVLIGIRSYEPKEAELLKKLHVKIYFMEEVAKRGIQTVMKEAIQYLDKQCDRLAISLDLDGLDPLDAPGTGTPVANGISAKAFLPEWFSLLNHHKCIGANIVEFNPTLDVEHKTMKLVEQLIKSES